MSDNVKIKITGRRMEMYEKIISLPAEEALELIKSDIDTQLTNLDGFFDSEESVEQDQWDKWDIGITK